MIDFNLVSAVLAGVLAVDAYVAFRCAMTIMSLIVTFWWATPLFFREKLAAEQKRERERAIRRLGRRD